MNSSAKRQPRGAGETDAADVVVYCSIDERGGPVNLRLIASTALASMCTFGLWDKTGNAQLATWNLTAGSSGKETYSIEASVETLNGTCLYWSIAICAVNPAIRTGFVQIQATQDGVACPVTENLRWSLHDVPPCSVNGDSVITIQRSLTFRNA
jgi:hypothetical protein